MENYRPVFQRDMHWGLVKETFKALLRSNMKNLTRTFLTLSLEDVATKANLKDSQEAERLLRSMVYRGEISAVIDQRAQMVSFALGSLEEEKGASSSNKKNTWNPTMLAESRRCIDLFHQLTQFYQNLSMDPQYMYREQDVEEVLDHSFC
jgi:COP9 signalosome complex subunit 3